MTIELNKFENGGSWFRFNYTDGETHYRYFEMKSALLNFAQGEGDHLIDWYSVSADEVFGDDETSS